MLIQINIEDTGVSDSPYLHMFDGLEQVHHQMEEQELKKAINFIITPSIETNVLNGIRCVAKCINYDYPFYSAQLYSISSQLFIRNQAPRFQPNPALNVMIFSELSVIERHLYSEPINIQSFSKIHPRIQRISGPLYADGHFSSAAEKAIKEVESRLRELFLELKPGASPPSNAAGLIGALLSEKGAYSFANDTTTSDSNYRRGIQSLFEGAFAAYRNPASHDNLSISQREALEQIFFGEPNDVCVHTPDQQFRLHGILAPPCRKGAPLQGSK